MAHSTCIESDYYSIMGGGDISIDSIVHDTAQVAPYLLAVAGKATIGGESGSFVYVFDFDKC
jgi:hypothetical protein